MRVLLSELISESLGLSRTSLLIEDGQGAIVGLGITGVYVQRSFQEGHETLISTHQIASPGSSPLEAGTNAEDVALHIRNPTSTAKAFLEYAKSPTELPDAVSAALASEHVSELPPNYNEFAAAMLSSHAAVYQQIYDE